ncbi:MAG: retention module-containing protein, partial [Gallionella sp.]|nr:retention module-containing protein [Gallionella sp.]
MAQTANIVGKVVILQGQVIAKSPDGTQRQLKLGDVVHEDEVITTGPGSKVEIAFDDGHTYLLREKETVTLDSIVIGADLDAKEASLLDRVGEAVDINRALAEGSSLDSLLEETAANLNGSGASNDGHDFVRVLRIAEALAPANYDYLGTGASLNDPRYTEGALLAGNVVAVISTGVGVVVEDVVLSTAGVLTITDLNAGQAAFQAQAGTVGAYGTFTLAANGAWTFALDNTNTTVQALGAGGTL